MDVNNLKCKYLEVEACLEVLIGKFFAAAARANRVMLALVFKLFGNGKSVSKLPNSITMIHAAHPDLEPKYMILPD